MTPRIAAAATCSECGLGRTIHPTGVCGRCRRVPLEQTPAQAPAPALAVVHAAPAPTENPATLMWLGDPVVAFTVYGVPGSQGSKNKGAHGQLYESSTKVKPWRDDVRDAFLAVRPAGWVPLDGPVALDFVVTIHRPKGAPKTVRVFPATNPDFDKLKRSTNDALKTAGMWLDDGQLVGYRRSWEFYTGDPDPDALNQPGAVIRAWRVPREAL